MPIIDPERLLEAVQESMFGTKGGEEHDGCEPDARNYPCDACGTNTVYGAQELLIMGYA